MALSYRLIRFSTLDVYRESQGSFVDGDWVDGTTTRFTVKAKIQPLGDTALALLPESDRNKSWVRVYIQEIQSSTISALRAAQQGVGGWGADEFVWGGFRYRVMKDANHNDSCIDHTRVLAARIELTPN